MPLAVRGVLTAGIVALTGNIAAAQALRPATVLPPAAVAESLAVLRDLDAQLRGNMRAAALWYRRGMVAWAMHERSGAPGAPRELQARNYARMADSSLRLATEYGEGQTRYKLDYARFLLHTGNVAMRALANTRFDDAVREARRGTDSLLWSDAAVEAARVHWRRYDSFKHRTMRVGEFDMARSISEAVQPGGKAQGELAALAGGGDAADAMFSSTPLGTIKAVEDLLRRTTQPLPGDVAGAADYEQASALFREAYAVAPTNARAVRGVAMVLADSGRWRELAAFAHTQLGAFPWDPQAWMILGLAEHRMGNNRNASAAFDSAFVFSAPADRARVDRIERVLRPSDSARVAAAPEPVRAATASVYWRVASPLWSRDGADPRTEFLARVTFADLRWTVDELGLRGADTDRGDVYIRYGPPDIARAVQPRATSEGQDIVTFWVYRSGLVFSFAGMPTWGTARTPVVDVGIAEQTKEFQPVRWDNIATYTVDSMATQVARFRADGDSIDIVIATAPPYRAIADASDVKSAVRGYTWLLRGGVVPAHADSVDLTGPGTRSVVARVAPATYIARAEVSANGSLRAARATMTIVADTAGRRSALNR
jgi:GWxTD domain-containing protein